LKDLDKSLIIVDEFVLESFCLVIEVHILDGPIDRKLNALVHLIGWILFFRLTWLSIFYFKILPLSLVDAIQEQVFNLCFFGVVKSLESPKLLIFFFNMVQSFLKHQDV
jgi:hypothetical protein